MNSVWCEGTQPAGEPTTGGMAVGSGSMVHGCNPGLPWVRIGNSAAATAAGLVDVWSTIRLLITRGWVSNTFAFATAYEEDGMAGEPGPKKPAGTPSAARNTGRVIRGNAT